MGKKRTEGQTTIFQTLHRKLNIESYLVTSEMLLVVSSFHHQ